MTDGQRRLAGRYRIDGLLGRGGMSEVHFGYDERLDRPVAVKLLRPPQDLSVLSRRAARPARLWAAGQPGKRHGVADR
jgi:serine/threonine protein kinase